MRQPFTAVVCTRDRGARILPTLEALVAEPSGFPLLVIDQGSEPAPVPHAPGDRIRVVRDDGLGLSRARNLAWREARTDWLAFVDDDCVVERGWGDRLADALARHPGLDFVSGEVRAGAGGPAGEIPVSTFAVDRERVLQGRWVRPWRIGLGVCFAVRRAAIERVGGWDERFGAGTQPFPAAEDMDFNLRLLRGGGRALITPAVRAEHHQWRSPAALPGHFEGYMRAWCGFAVKTGRTGSPAAGAWLWADAVLDVARTVVAAARRRSPLLARVAARKLRGMAHGTVAGWRTAW